MKKQINPTIKAHLLRSALILLSLLVVCVIPFAFGQRTHRDQRSQRNQRAQQGQRGTSKSSPQGTICTPGWSAGSDLPGAGVRFVGVFFPANGKFYAMGGRDASDVEFTHPFEYDPVANTWTTKSASYPDASTNNMGCGILTDSGAPYIYCTGGSNFASQTTIERVFRYDPIADVITTVAAPWPPGTNTLPGGFTVFNNKFYILGGFDIPDGVGTDQIWEFTPTTNVWVQKSTVLPVPLGYIPTAAIGSLIYTGGGADITGGSLTDTTNSFVYNPVADSITTIATIPRATSNTRGLNFNGQMWVLGGQFPTPANEVDIYDPVTDSWSVGAPMLTPRRNFATDTNGINHIWAAGGYDDTGVANVTTEIFCGGGAPTVTSAVSREMHTGVGNFDVDLPLTGTPGIEDRTGGATNDYTMVVTFTGNVTVTGNPQAQVTMGTGCVGSGGVCMSGNNVNVNGAIVSIPLTNITNAQTINVRLNGVNLAADEPAVDVVIPMTVLIGDTNASGSVSSADIAQTKGRIGQTVTTANFRSDVNASGGINPSDVTIIKQHLP